MRKRNRDINIFNLSMLDVISGALGAFLIIMVVLFPYYNKKNINFENEARQLSQQLSKAKFERDKAREQLQALTEQLTEMEESVRAQGLDLVVAVDISGSMDDALGHLVETINTIARVLPIITPKFRLSIIGYRGDPSKESQTYFNYDGVYSEDEDGGTSLNELDEFLSKLEAKNGLAPIGWAVDESLNVFSKYAASKEYGDSYKIFFLLGDVGPYELSFEDMLYKSEKRKYEDQITHKITNWVKQSEKHRVITLFSGSPPSTEADQAYHVRYRESLRFFKDIAIKAGQPENFTQNPGKMLAYLLSAIVKKE